MKPFIQEWAESLGINSAVNGSWMQAIAFHYGVSEPVGGTWDAAVASHFGITEPLNGSWIQAIAYDFGSIFPDKGLWIQGILGGEVPPTDNWILNTGFWSDSGEWLDTDVWNDGDLVMVYSQVVEFDTPMNSIQYRCDGSFLAASYGQNRTNLDDLVAMFNQLPPEHTWSNFLDYGVCYNNGDGRVRMAMYQSAYDALACTGSLTLNVIYD